MLIPARRQMSLTVKRARAYLSEALIWLSVKRELCMQTPDWEKLPDSSIFQLSAFREADDRPIGLTW